MRLWATSEHVSRPRDRWMAFPWVRIIYEAFDPVRSDLFMRQQAYFVREDGMSRDLAVE